MIIEKVRKKGVKGSIKAALIRMHLIEPPKPAPKPKPVPKPEIKHRILLLTNKNSDNVGDQVIETCDMALIQTVLRNLAEDVNMDEVKIDSRFATIVPPEYIATKDEKYLQKARKAIANCDVVIFGGAPMFNYMYQNFYERTATTIEVAQEFGKPVIFSAIGIEHYDEENAKCQRLKKALNLDCVRQITTRDHYELLEKYKEKEELVIGKVSDPAVFSDQVFKKFLDQKPREKKKIGIFILRSNGFKSNKVDFSDAQTIEMWRQLVEELEMRGYDYELVTSGHFSDEAFLSRMMNRHGFRPSKSVFNINCSEHLVSRISGYDGVVSCRLHPSIIAYSLSVPSIGLEWNPKVRGFYESIGYDARSMDVTKSSAADIADRLEEAVAEGVEKEDTFLKSVYDTLFYGIKNCLAPESQNEPYTLAEFKENVVPYAGTTPKEMQQKLRKKFNRAYRSYNALLDKNREFQRNADAAKQ